MPVKPPPAPALRAYIKTAVERHAIYERRAAGQPWPWTKDELFQTYKFCNVFRELDTVTRWIDRHIRKPYAKHPDLWWMLAAARQINWPDTLADLIATPGAWPEDGLKSWRPATMARTMRKRAAAGQKVYTGAYMLSGTGIRKLNLVDKPHLTAHILTELRKSNGGGVEHASTIQEAHILLRQQYGFGAFLAYEVATDMRHTRYLNKAPDIMTFANAGPGAKRGLARLYGRKIVTYGPAEQTMAEMISILPAMQRAFPHRAVELRDVEHQLCEHDKYLRVLLGQGRPRARYSQPAPL